MVETRTKIVINGVEYSRIEDVPPEFRSLLEDRDGSGLPDALERGLRGKSPGTAAPIPDGAREISFSTEKRKEEFCVDGRKYDRLEDVPEPARSALRDALVPRPRTGSPAAFGSRESIRRENSADLAKIHTACMRAHRPPSQPRSSRSERSRNRNPW